MRWFVVVLAGALAVYNNVLNLIDQDLFYVPLNVSVAAGLVVGARRVGLDNGEIGLARDGIGPGLRWGGVVVAAIVAGLALVFFVPFLRPFLGDERAAMSGGMLAFHALVRIPLGTVVLEEVAFRGVLLGAWKRLSGMKAAVAGSCVIFGLWHVVPALELVRVNEIVDGALAEAGLVSLAVVATGASGLILVALRIWTKGIWGPAVVHAGANSLALLAAFGAR